MFGEVGFARIGTADPGVGAQGSGCAQSQGEVRVSRDAVPSCISHLVLSTVVSAKRPRLRALRDNRCLCLLGLRCVALGSMWYMVRLVGSDPSMCGLNTDLIAYPGGGISSQITVSRPPSRPRLAGRLLRRPARHHCANHQAQQCPCVALRIEVGRGVSRVALWKQARTCMVVRMRNAWRLGQHCSKRLTR